MFLKKILLHIFPWLQLKNKNLSPAKRLWLYIETGIAFMMVLWILWLFVGIPSTFNHRYKIDRITFFTTDPLTPKEKNLLRRYIVLIDTNLSRRGVNISDVEASVYLEKSDLFFKLSLVPGMQFFTYGSALTVGKLLFMPNADIVHNVFIYQSHQKGLLSEALAHELVHVWQNSIYATWFPIFFQKRWIIEGYAVYVTNDKIMYDSKLLRQIFTKDATLERHSKQKYALWGLMVKHAIEEMHVSVDDLHRGKVGYDEVYASLLRKHRLSDKP